MKGQAIGLLKYMEGAEKHFYIPPYQRNYDWDNTNCEQLLKDISEVAVGNRSSHFFGSIITKHNGKEYIIIDGQQRIITVTLLLLALYNLLEEGTIKSVKNDLKDVILHKYLGTKVGSRVAKKTKLESIKKDQKDLDILFAGKEKHSSNVAERYKHFSRRIPQEISKRQITVDQFFAAIGKLEIIDIGLGSADMPQMVFESLNSTGRPLTEGDKIGNFILMNLDSEKQRDYYRKYWNPIENYTSTRDGQYNVTPFIRDYLSLKYEDIVDQKDVYRRFKEYADGKKSAGSGNKVIRESLLKELLAYAEEYDVLIKDDIKQFSKPQEYEKCIVRLNYLEVTVIRPFLLEVLMLYKKGGLTITQVGEIFKTIESYVLRRLVCGWSASAINRMFIGLHKEIVGYDKTTANYVEKLKYALYDGADESVRFPKDDEFLKGFAENPTYNSNKRAMYILERLENHEQLENRNSGGTVKKVDLYNSNAKEKYTVEHIMPQNIKNKTTWKNAFKQAGDNPEEMHDKWLHRIGNLSLLTDKDNSDASNNSFEIKVELYKKSGLLLNSYIAKIAKKGEVFTWTSKELEKRSKHLEAEALKIWPKDKEITYTPPPRSFEDCTLVKAADYFNGRKLQSITFRSKKSWDVPKGSKDNAAWKKMAQEVIEFIYNDSKENASIIAELAESEEKEYLASRFFKNERKKLILIRDTEFYVSIPGSNETKIDMLQKLFDKCDIPRKELVLKLEPLNNSEKGKKQ